MRYIKSLIILAITFFAFPLYCGVKGCVILCWILCCSRCIWNSVGLFRLVVKQLVYSMPLSVWIHSTGNGNTRNNVLNIAEEYVLCSSKVSTKRYGIFIKGGILKELFVNDLGVFEIYGRNKLYINLRALPWIVHLFIRLWNTFRIGWMNYHCALLTKKTIWSGNGTGVTTLLEFVSKDNKFSSLCDIKSFDILFLLNNSC